MRIKQTTKKDVLVEHVDKGSILLLSHGFGDELLIDKEGAKKLIEVLLEFVEE